MPIYGEVSFSTKVSFWVWKHSKRRKTANLLFAIGLFLSFLQHADGAPPFDGTIFLDPDIITEADPTTYEKIVDGGRGQRTMFDRRANWVNLNAFLFNASFSDGPDIEIQVNAEFGDSDTARIQALRFAPVIGRLPRCLREDVETVWIHRGNNPFGGGNNNLLIHTGQAEEYEASGILEETLAHEGSHTSLDGKHASAPEWIAAQNADDEFISTYARDNPTREDVAETFLLYFALRYRPGRISQDLAATIASTVPNRIAYFDRQELGLSTLDDSGSKDTSAEIPNDGKETSQNSWNLATDHGSGWKSFDWFGSYCDTATGWIYHHQLGWLYRASDATESIWLWKEELGWIWTRATLYPHLYHQDTLGWLYFRSGPNGFPAFYYYRHEKWATYGD